MTGIADAKEGRFGRNNQLSVHKCTQTENRNDDLLVLLKRKLANRIEIVRGGSVA